MIIIIIRWFVFFTLVIPFFANCNKIELYHQFYFNFEDIVFCLNNTTKGVENFSNKNYM